MEAEYQKRVTEQKRLIDAYNQLDSGYSISVIEGDYEPEIFYAAAKGLEQCPEGGERCFACYELRLRKTAELAKDHLFLATFASTHTHNNSVDINHILPTIQSIAYNHFSS